MARYRGLLQSTLARRGVPPDASRAGEPVEEKKETNAGGLWGGIGYTAEKLGLGVMQGFEGAADYVVGGLADLFGADEFAEYVFDNVSDWFPARSVA